MSNLERNALEGAGTGGRSRRLVSRIALVCALVFIATFGADWFSSDSILIQNDFFQYWSGARYLLAGGNPYDQSAFFAFQLDLGWQVDRPIRTWIPPWGLALFLPLAGVRFGHAFLAWLVLQGSMIIACATVVWRELERERHGERTVVFLSVLFPSSVYLLLFGQITGWSLLGTTFAFLGLRRRGSFLTGLSLPLLLVKPHLMLLLFAALVIRTLGSGRWATLVWSGVALAALLAVPLAVRPSIPIDYVQSLVNTPPDGYVSDTLAAGLGVLLGNDVRWIQFMPLGIGLCWLAAVMVRSWGVSRWPSDAVPLLALVSAFVAPYGWFFDLVVAVPALVFLWWGISSFMDSRARRIFLVCFGMFWVVFVILHHILWDPYSWVHGWLAGFLLLVYATVRQRLPKLSAEEQAHG